MPDGTMLVERGRSDTTPLATRVALLATLAVTALVLGLLWLGPVDPADSGDVAPALWLFTGLFVLRVAGQILVAARPRRWLPPMEQWNLLPYPILLPIQIVFIVIMTWIDVSFTWDAGIPVEKSRGFGIFLIVFSAIYALSMAIRYAMRMSRRPDQRWFGGTIPIVFHVVLASYLCVLGSFYATG